MSLQLTVLGCGDAFSSGGRYNTCFLVSYGSHKILIDCGGTTLVRLKQLNIDLNEISHVCLTHFHGDHYGGLPFFFLSTFFEYQRKSPLTILGPEGLKEKVYALQEAMYPETSWILDELDLRFECYETNNWMDMSHFSILAMNAVHAPASCPHSLKIKVGEQILAYSGDTEWTDNLIALSENCEILIVECNNHKTESPGHLSLMKLIEKKHLLKAQRIFLTHMGTEVIDLSEMPFERLADGIVIDI